MNQRVELEGAKPTRWWPPAGSAITRSTAEPPEAEAARQYRKMG